MQFVGLTCLVGLTAMTMLRTHALDRQIETMRRQHGNRAIRRAQGQRAAILSSIVAVFILLVLGCTRIDDLAGWMTVPGVSRNTLVLGLLLIFGFVTSLPGRYYSGRSAFGWNFHAGRNVKSYLNNQAILLLAGVIIGTPLLWAFNSAVRSATGPWWLYSWCALVVALVLEPVVRGRIIIPGISVMKPVGRVINDQIAMLLKQLGFKNAGVLEWAPATWAGDVGIQILGFGSSRRVVIPARLLQTLHGDEIAAVVAHGIGHGRAGHGALRLIARAVKLFVILGMFAWLAGRPQDVPGVDSGREAQALSVFAALLLLDMTLKLLTLIERKVERHVEFKADSFVNGLSGPEALTRALLKLSGEGEHAPTPDPLYSLINDRIPPASLRIARLRVTAPVLMPVEQAEEHVPAIGQLPWGGRAGLLTFSGSDAIRDLASAAEQPSWPADAAAPKRKRQRRSPAAGTKRVRASLSMG